MNLILLDEEELAGNGEVVLADRRAEHLRRVLRVDPGDRVRVGLIGGNQGEAEVLAVEDRAVRLRYRLDRASPGPGRDVLFLAFARPKVLLRCLEHATALGFGRVVIFRCRRVERSHLSSSAVEPSVIESRLRRGLEQARRTHLPEVVLVPRFRQLVEQVGALATRDNRFVAHPEAEERAGRATLVDAGLTVVIGPEGGISEHELSELSKAEFRLVRAGWQPLRVETALSYLAGHLRAARLQCGAEADE